MVTDGVAKKRKVEKKRKGRKKFTSFRSGTGLTRRRKDISRLELLGWTRMLAE